MLSSPNRSPSAPGNFLLTGNFFFTGNSSLCRPQCPAQPRPDRPRRRWGRRGGRRAEQIGRAVSSRAEQSRAGRSAAPGQAPLSAPGPPRRHGRGAALLPRLPRRPPRRLRVRLRARGRAESAAGPRVPPAPRYRGRPGAGGAAGAGRGRGRPGPFPARIGPGREGSGARERRQGRGRDAGRRRWSQLAAVISAARRGDKRQRETRLSLSSFSLSSLSSSLRHKCLKGAMDSGFRYGYEDGGWGGEGET